MPILVYSSGAGGSGGGGGVNDNLPSQVTNLKSKYGNNMSILTWTNPTDYFSGLIIVRKANGVPTGIKDGTQVYDGTASNFTDTTAVNGTLYYYRFFPYNSKKQFQTDMKGGYIDCTPTAYVIYGVRINLADANPATSCVYTDDATNFTPSSGNNGNFIDNGWSDRQIYRDIRPCLLLNGSVVGYLNKNNFTQFENGVAADITSGDSGDVMIEIPRMAYMMYTEGNYVYVKITDNPNAKDVDSRFVYHAHSRASEGDRQNLYVGTYFGFNLSNKLRSLSGRVPTVSQNYSQFQTLARNNGSGYDMLSFYPYTLLQCLYLIRYRHLNSQIALGRGYTNAQSVIATGATNANGMNYGSSVNNTRVKCNGVEDFWGNAYSWLDGLYCDGSHNILTGYTNFNATGNGYFNRGNGGVTTNIGGYMSKCMGTSDLGFITREVAGSATTYFSDYGYLYGGCLPMCGGSYGCGDHAGTFYLYVYLAASNAFADLGARLMFL